MSAWDATSAFGELARVLAKRPQRALNLPPEAFRESAVLAALQLRDGVPHLLFTRRPETFRHHAGQISFPGGARDASDGTALFTALRELEEELGVPAAQVEVLGPLDEIPTPTGFRIAPFVGRIADDVALAPNPAEVDALLTLPLAAFFAPGLPRAERRELFGRGRDIYFYDVEGHTIWGATAHILRALLDEVAALPAWRPFTQTTGRNDA